MAIITAQRILTELGNRAWSGFNKDDMIWGNDDAIQAQTELNVAVRYLMNLEDFPFRSKQKKINTIINQFAYSFPEGQIINIYNDETNENLVFYGSGDNYNKTITGTPTGYWVNYNNPDEKIRLYPIPDKKVTYNVIYNTFYPVMTQDGDLAMEFKNKDDYINMPELIQDLFMDCLVLRVMVTNNKDEQDENFAPTQAEFNEYWKLFKKVCKASRNDSYTIF